MTTASPCPEASMMWLPCGLLFAPWAAVSALRHRKSKRSDARHHGASQHGTGRSNRIVAHRVRRAQFDVIGLPRNIDEAGRWLVFDCVEVA